MEIQFQIASILITTMTVFSIPLRLRMLVTEEILMETPFLITLMKIQTGTASMMWKKVMESTMTETA